MSSVILTPQEDRWSLLLTGWPPLCAAPPKCRRPGPHLERLLQEDSLSRLWGQCPSAPGSEMPFLHLPSPKQTGCACYVWDMAWNTGCMKSWAGRSLRSQCSKRITPPLVRDGAAVCDEKPFAVCVLVGHAPFPCACFHDFVFRPRNRSMTSVTLKDVFGSPCLVLNLKVYAFCQI